MTVWFELPEVICTKHVLILINEKNKIGMITLDYNDNTPSLTSFRLSKHTYDKLTECSYSSKSIADSAGKPYKTSDTVKWIALSTK